MYVYICISKRDWFMEPTPICQLKSGELWKSKAWCLSQKAWDSGVWLSCEGEDRHFNSPRRRVFSLAFYSVVVGVASRMLPQTAERHLYSRHWFRCKSHLERMNGQFGTGWCFTSSETSLGAGRRSSQHHPMQNAFINAKTQGSGVGALVVNQAREGHASKLQVPFSIKGCVHHLSSVALWLNPLLQSQALLLTEVGCFVVLTSQWL